MRPRVSTISPMASTAVHCISCGSQAIGTDGKARCTSCGQEFEYTMVAHVQGVLEYQRPIPSPLKKLNRLCSVALAVSFFSCLFPLIAVASIGLAIAGLLKIRRTQEGGVGYAIASLVLSVVGTFVFVQFYIGYNEARSSAVCLSCLANLRQISQGISLYENAHPGARGYGFADLQRQDPSLVLRCPDPADPVPAPMTGAVATSYVLLTSLQPFNAASDPSSIIAFELSPHRFGSAERHNVLFADGHAEEVRADDLPALIQKSLLAPRQQKREKE